MKKMRFIPKNDGSFQNDGKFWGVMVLFSQKGGGCHDSRRNVVSGLDIGTIKKWWKVSEGKTIQADSYADGLAIVKRNEYKYERKSDNYET